ncbi:MAG: sigma 54-interacting transcriptional regulator [Phycisphaerae bacterium]|nr:sigma 54-interacting transcriptional regulator [Phycisphaerae bacterium]
MQPDVPAARMLLEGVFANAADGVFVLDSKQECVLFNHTCEHLTGYLAAEVLGTRYPAFDPSETSVGAGAGWSPVVAVCPDLRPLRNGVDSIRKQIRIRHKDGSTRAVQGHFVILRDEQGEPAGLIGVLRPRRAGGFSEEQIRSICENLPAKFERLRIEAREQYGFTTILSASPKMREPLTQIRASCDQPAAVLLIGEMGTGKETAARAIHRNGPRAGSRFVMVNCTAHGERLNQELFGAGSFEGLIRAADKGTLFLEAVADMPPETQAGLSQVLKNKLVRSLGSNREHPVDLRVIASSRQSLDDAVACGRFREDLYRRLGIVTINLPPLRERREDIPYLVWQRLADLNLKSTQRRINSVASEVWTWFYRYRWPGNIRELNGVVESAFALGSGEQLLANDLPNLIRGELVEMDDPASRLDRPLDNVLSSVEREAILTALRRSDGRRSQAARDMGISRSRLYRRMEALGIHPREDL